MQTLKLSLSLPDETHPEMELRLSTDDLTCDVVISLPAGVHADTAPPSPAYAAPGDVRILLPSANDADAATDAYVLGGYAGI